MLRLKLNEIENEYIKFYCHIQEVSYHIQEEEESRHLSKLLSIVNKH
jgi:hypothetical protein